MSTATTQRLSVTLGEDDTVVVRVGAHGQPIIARALGIERDAAGQIARIYLDRLVHRGAEICAAEWRAHGAISTILTRLSA